MNVGKEAFRRGQYADAEKQFRAALREAEKFGPDHDRLAASLLVLGGRV